MTNGPPPHAARRVTAELIRDPTRSNAIIAIQARTASQYVGRVRTALERSGAIEPVDAADRAQRVRTWSPRAPRKAVEAGCTTPAEIMQLAPDVSYQAAWRALARSRRAGSIPDAAAALDSLSVTKTTRPQPQPTRFRVGVTLPRGYYQPADSIETSCRLCTLEYREGRWQHARACPLARARS
jgi:hypothetical protein